MPSFCNIMLEMSHNYIANGVNHFGHYLRNINNNKVPNKASLNNDLENSIQFNSVHLNWALLNHTIIIGKQVIYSNRLKNFLPVLPRLFKDKVC